MVVHFHNAKIICIRQNERQSKSNQAPGTVERGTWAPNTSDLASWDLAHEGGFAL